VAVEHDETVERVGPARDHVREIDAAQSFVGHALSLRIDDHSGKGKLVQLRIGPELRVGKRFARQHVPVERGEIGDGCTERLRAPHAFAARVRCASLQNPGRLRRHVSAQ
jgi:hypothetical protein